MGLIAPCAFSITRAEPIDGVEVDRSNFLRLQAGGIPGRIPVDVQAQRFIHDGMLRIGSFDRHAARLGRFVPRVGREALLYVRTQDLDFGGDPTPGEPELWPGAEGRANMAQVVLQHGRRKSVDQEQLVRIQKNRPAWLADQEGRSVLLNYRDDGVIEFVRATPVEVARGIISILRVNHTDGNKMVFTRAAHWASHNLTRLASANELPSDILQAERTLRKRLDL